MTDSVIKSDLLNQIPVLSSLMALGGGYFNFRDKRYANKLLHFLAETTQSSEEDKKNYREKLDTNPKEGRKAGEVLLDNLDKITSVEKATMIGQVFRAFMHEDKIKTEDVITLSEMIEKAYIRDLLALKEDSGEWDDTYLESVGIKKPMRTEDINEAISNAVDKVMQEIPIARETPKYDIPGHEIMESGLTDMGFLLKRILQEY
jgi:hypothetical protein